MGQPVRFGEDGILVLGPILGATQIDIPAGEIVNAAISASAAIAASKCQKGLAAHVSRSGTVVTETLVIHVVKGATGTLTHFTVSNVTAAAGASTATVDLQKNGVTVLSAAVTLNAATGNLGEEVGIISSASVVDGDVLTVVITAVQSGTDALATGVMAQLDLDEDYAA